MYKHEMTVQIMALAYVYLTFFIEKSDCKNQIAKKLGTPVIGTNYLGGYLML